MSSSVFPLASGPGGVHAELQGRCTTVNVEVSFTHGVNVLFAGGTLGQMR